MSEHREKETEMDKVNHGVVSHVVPSNDNSLKGLPQSINIRSSLPEKVAGEDLK